MSHDEDIERTDPKRVPALAAEPAEDDRMAEWLDALNSFLERANKADLDTGC